LTDYTDLTRQLYNTHNLSVAFSFTIIELNNTKRNKTIWLKED